MVMDRFCFFITKKNKQLLKKASKLNGHTMGDIINALLEQKLLDPIALLKSQKKDLAKKMYQLDQQIKDLEV